MRWFDPETGKILLLWWQLPFGDGEQGHDLALLFHLIDRADTEVELEGMGVGVGVGARDKRNGR